MANSWDVMTLIAVFAAGWAAIMGVTLLVVKRVNPGLGKGDRGLVLWFVLCELNRLDFVLIWKRGLK